MKSMKFLALLALSMVAGVFTSCEDDRGNDPKNPLATVTIAGTKWTTANLTAAAGATSGHRIGATQDYGSYFKWGSKYTYDNTNVGEGWSESNFTIGAATNPTSSSTGGRGYDYVGLSGGTAHPGDPCQSLGANYKTPTHAQWIALVANSNKWGTYRGINGYFFGVNAVSCTDATIATGCIFIPASGCRDYYDGSHYSQSSHGLYWSSSVQSANDGYSLYFNNSNVTSELAAQRAFGYSVRCVQE